MRLIKAVGVVAVAAGVLSMSAGAFSIVADPLPIAVVGTPYAYVPELHGGGAPFAFYLEGGTLPQGMFIRVDDGCICGTPQESGTFVFNLLGYSGIDNPPPWQHTDSPEFTLTVKPRLFVTSNSLTSATVGAPYTATLTAAGGNDLQWSLQSGVLPPGLALASNGTISGTPTTVGSWGFTVKVTDADGRSATQQLAISVADPLTAAVSGAVPQSEVGRPFTLALTGSGGVPPTSWSITGGTAPPGLAVDPVTGVLSGTPTAAGAFSFQVGLQDAGGRVATVDVTVVVAPALKLVATKLRGGVVASRYSAKLRATGGVAGKTWKFVGVKPAWLHLNAKTGALSGTPTKARTFRFKVKVTDSLKASSTKAFALKVRPY
jgi:hypothetical protein